MLPTELLGLAIGLAGLIASLLTAGPRLRQALWVRRLSHHLTPLGFDRHTVRRSTANYIRPTYCDQDPSAMSEEAAERLKRHDLFQLVDRLVTAKSEFRHLMVLSDSGTGKTSFALNYYARSPRERRRLCAVIPLGGKNPAQRIEAAISQGASILFLDALDEYPLTASFYTDQLFDLMKYAEGADYVIITCRSQFFKRKADIPQATNVLRLGPRAAGEDRIYEFRRVYLAPFSRSDVRRYIRRRFSLLRPKQRRAAENLVLQVPSLSVRPMLLAELPELLKRNRSYELLIDIYEELARGWALRERYWVKNSDLLAFSELLAVQLLEVAGKAGRAALPLEDIDAQAQAWGVDLGEYVIRTRSLLNRDEDDNYKFSHRSFLEFFAVRALLRGPGRELKVELTDFMKVLLLEDFTGRPVGAGGQEEAFEAFRDLPLLAKSVGREDFLPVMGSSELALELQKLGSRLVAGTAKATTKLKVQCRSVVTVAKRMEIWLEKRSGGRWLGDLRRFGDRVATQTVELHGSSLRMAGSVVEVLKEAKDRGCELREASSLLDGAKSFERLKGTLLWLQQEVRQARAQLGERERRALERCCRNWARSVKRLGRGGRALVLMREFRRLVAEELQAEGAGLRMLWKEVEALPEGETRSHLLDAVSSLAEIVDEMLAGEMPPPARYEAVLLACSSGQSKRISLEAQALDAELADLSRRIQGREWGNGRAARAAEAVLERTRLFLRRASPLPLLTAVLDLKSRTLQAARLRRELGKESVHFEGTHGSDRVFAIYREKGRWVLWIEARRESP